MITEQELLELLKLVESRDVFLLFDETYREMSFEKTISPAATLSKRAISISTMSKCYSLPGIRIGWIATQGLSLVESFLAIREQIAICSNSLGEEIALCALSQKQRFLRQAKEHIGRNRQLVADWIDEQTQFEWVYPEAGVVSFPRIKPENKLDPERFYRLLAKKYRTFVVSGRCFEMDSRYFRLGFGATQSEIETGLRNINRALNELV